MKKYFFLFIFSFNFIVSANTILYTSKTVNTYSNEDSIKKTGKVYPTTSIRVIKTYKKKAFIEIQGWIKNDISRILYFTYGKRIVAAAFRKKAKYVIKKDNSSILKDNKNKWQKASIYAWVTNDGFVRDINNLFKKADALIKENCSLCHPLPNVDEHYSNQWPSIVKAMRIRTPLNKEEGLLIIQYFQKHAED